MDRNSKLTEHFKESNKVEVLLNPAWGDRVRSSGRDGDISKTVIDKDIPSYVNKSIKNYEQGKPLGVQIFEYMQAGNTKYGQRAVEAWSKTREILNKHGSALHTALDIENLGIKPGDFKPGGFNFFALSEIGISGWKMEKKGAGSIWQNVGENMSLVGRITENQAGELMGYIDQLERGSLKLDPKGDLARTLRSLTTYSEESAFTNKTFGPGLALNVVIADNIKRGNIPKATANLRKWTNEMRAGLNNLVTYGNSFGNLMEALNARFSELGKTGSLIGYNVLQHDIPALMEYIDGEISSGKLNSNEVAVGRSVRKRLKSLVTSNRVNDVYHLLSATHLDPLTEIPASAHSADRFWYETLADGHMTQENIARLHRLAPVTHNALNDSIASVRILDKFGQNISGTLDKALSGGHSYKDLKTAQMVVRNTPIGIGSKLYSVTGMSPALSSALDNVYRMDDKGRLMPAYSGQVSPLFRNVEYTLVDVSLRKRGLLPEHEHGSWVTTLYNKEEDLYHVFVRPETIAGTGIDDVRSLIQKHFVPSTAFRGGLPQANRMEDRAMRAYNSMFERGGFNLAKRYYGALGVIPEGVSVEALQTTPGFKEKFNSSTEARNFYYLRDRLQAESDIFTPFLSQIERSGINNVQADYAMSEFRDILEGKTPVAGVAGREAIGSLMKTEVYNRAVNLNNGILNMGSLDQTRSSLNSAAKRSGLLQLVAELQSKGYLTSNESNKLRKLVSYAKQDKDGRVVNTLASIMFRRVTLANEKNIGGFNRKDQDAIISVMEDMTRGVMISNSVNARLQNPGALNGAMAKAIQGGISRGTGFSNAWELQGERLKSMVAAHDTVISQQLAPFSGAKGGLKMPEGAGTHLRKLAQAYMTSDTSVMFLSGQNTNSIVMAVFAKKQAEAITRMSPMEIMRAKNVLTMDIPFVNNDRLMVVGNTMRVNRMYLTGSNAFMSGQLKIETGFDKLMNSYERQSKYITNMISSGDMVGARRRGRFIFSQVFSDLAGVGRFERYDELTEHKIRQLSKPAIRQVSNILDMEGAIPYFLGHTDMSGLNLKESMHIKRNLEQKVGDYLGIPLNTHTVKEGQFAKGFVSSIEDIRDLIPLSTWSAAATQRMTQSLNVQPIGDDIANQLAIHNPQILNPLVMTEKGLSVFGTSNGKAPPWLTYKVGYMDDMQVNELIKARGMDFELMPSTYEARAFMREDIAKNHKLNIMNEYIVDELAEGIKVGAPLQAKDRKPITVGFVTKDGIISGRQAYDKADIGIVKEIINQNGKHIVRVERELAAQTGMKLMTSTGEKMTVTLLNTTDWKRMFGDLGDQMYLVMASSAEKHRAYGDIMKSQIGTMVSELNALTTTVGNTQRAQIQASVETHLSQFFGGRFRYGSLGKYGSASFEGLIAPNAFEITNSNKLLSLKKFDEMLGGISADVSRITGKSFDIRDRLSANVAGVRIALGIENIGRQPIEWWYKRAGFGAPEKGVLKYGPRELEMLRIRGYDHISRFYQNEVVAESRRATEQLFNYNEVWRGGKASQEAMGEAGRYHRALLSLSGEGPHVDDVFFRSQGGMSFGPMDINFGVLKDFPVLDKDEVSTMDKYRGTYFDLKNFALSADANIQPGDLTEDKLRQMMVKGGAWFDLPTSVSVDGKIMDKLFLPYGTPTSIEKAATQSGKRVNVVQANKLLSSSAGIIRAINDVSSGTGTPEDLQEAVDRYAKTVFEDIGSSSGFISRKALSARMRGSGQFQIQTFSPMDDVKTGTMYVNEKDFRQMMANFEDTFDDKLVGKRARGALMNKAKTEGVLALANRFPTIGYESIQPVRIMTHKNVARNTVMMTVGDAVVMGADNDGDFLSVVMSHYRGKTAEQIGVETNDDLLKELGSIWKASLTDRTRYDTIAKADYTSKAGGQTWSYGDWVKTNADQVETARMRIFGSGITQRTVGLVTREAIEARVGREVIGYFSNIGTSMVRMAEAVRRTGASGLTSGDMLAVAKFGELVQQAPISSKHFSYEAILKAANDTGRSAEDILAERIGVVGSLEESLKTLDVNKFKDAARTLGAFDVDATRLPSGEIQYTTGAKFQIRQPFTVDEIFGALGKLNTEVGSISQEQWGAGMRFGVSGGPRSIRDLYDVAKGQTMLNSSVVEQYFDMVGIKHGEARARLANAIQNRLAYSQESADLGEFATKFFGDFSQRITPQNDITTVGEETMSRIFSGWAPVANKMASIGWGAGAFAGLMLTANAFKDPLPADMMPRADEAPTLDGRGIPTPNPSPGGPAARVIPGGSGYENLQVSISARDTRGLSDEQIGQMVQQQIASAMPVQFNMNISSSDNTQRIDRLWVQSVVQDALTKGQAF